MIGQACRHYWRALPPARTNRPLARTLVPWQRLPQTHMGACYIVEGLKEDHTLPQALAVFTEAGRLPHQWRQGLPHGQSYPLDQPC